jgi:hypothetical protein
MLDQLELLTLPHAILGGFMFPQPTIPAIQSRQQARPLHQRRACLSAAKRSIRLQLTGHPCHW